jgi:hypothetical protein
MLLVYILTPTSVLYFIFYIMSHKICNNCFKKIDDNYEYLCSLFIKHYDHDESDQSNKNKHIDRLVNIYYNAINNFYFQHVNQSFSLEEIHEFLDKRKCPFGDEVDSDDDIINFEDIVDIEYKLLNYLGLFKSCNCNHKKCKDYDGFKKETLYKINKKTVFGYYVIFFKC